MRNHNNGFKIDFDTYLVIALCIILGEEKL